MRKPGNYIHETEPNVNWTVSRLELSLDSDTSSATRIAPEEPVSLVSSTDIVIHNSIKRRDIQICCITKVVSMHNQHQNMRHNNLIIFFNQN